MASVKTNFRVKTAIYNQMTTWATARNIDVTEVARGLLRCWLERHCPRMSLPATVRPARGEPTALVTVRIGPDDEWWWEPVQGHCAATGVPITHALTHAWAAVVSRASIEARSPFDEETGTDPAERWRTPPGYVEGQRDANGRIPWWPAARSPDDPEIATYITPPYPLRQPELEHPPSPEAWPDLASALAAACEKVG